MQATRNVQVGGRQTDHADGSAAAARTPHIGMLSPDLMLAILRRVPFEDRKDCCPLVCKDWAQLLRSPYVWSQGIKDLRLQLFDFLPPPTVKPAALYLSSDSRSNRFSYLLSPPWNREPASGAAMLTDTHVSPGSPEVVRLGTSVGPGFLAHVLTQYLTHLEQLRIRRSGRIMNNEDLRAVSCLTNLQRLEISNLESSEKLVSSSDAGFSGLLMLQKLEHLTLELRLLSFPSAICQLPSLRCLTLRDLEELHMSMNPLQFDWEEIVADGANNLHAGNGAGPMLPVPPFPFHNPNLDETDSDSSDTGSGDWSSYSGGSSGDSSDGGGMHTYNMSFRRLKSSQRRIPDASAFSTMPPFIRDTAGAGRGVQVAHTHAPPHEGPVASTSRWLPTNGGESLAASSLLDHFSNDLEVTPRAGTATAADALGAGPSGGTASAAFTADVLDPQQQPPTEAAVTPQQHGALLQSAPMLASSRASSSSGSPSTWTSDKPTAVNWYSRNNRPVSSLGTSEELDSGQSGHSPPVNEDHDTSAAGPSTSYHMRAGSFEQRRTATGLRAGSVPCHTQPTPRAATNAVASTSRQSLVRPESAPRQSAGDMGPSTSAAAAAVLQQLSLGHSGLVEVNDNHWRLVPYLEQHTRPASKNQPFLNAAQSQHLLTRRPIPSNSIWMSGDWRPPPAQAATQSAHPQASTSAPSRIQGAPAAGMPELVVQGTSLLPTAGYNLAVPPDESEPPTPPDEDGFPTQLAFLSRLHTLSLSCCDLEAVPPVIGHLTSLRSLALSGNRPHATRHAFFYLPSDCRSLEHLTHLSLASNKLEAVPLEMAAFTALRDLDLSHNLIYDLPSTLHSLARLRNLSLHRNRIHVLPPVLTQLTRLTALDVTGNDLIYDGTASRIAAMPRLRKFDFPAPCDSFIWDHKKGLQDPSSFGVTKTSAHCFQNMLSCLQQRRRNLARCHASQTANPKNRIPRPLFPVSPASSPVTGAGPGVSQSTSDSFRTDAGRRIKAGAEVAGTTDTSVIRDSVLRDTPDPPVAASQCPHDLSHLPLSPMQRQVSSSQGSGLNRAPSIGMVDVQEARAHREEAQRRALQNAMVTREGHAELSDGGSSNDSFGTDLKST